ncbi:MAG: hypothetical protein LBL93_02570 [Ruminococcus sp.]|nr:hypothetical protein [Ruminococcus sp.]
MEKLQKNHGFTFWHTFTLDGKGRVSIPAAYREELGETIAACRFIGNQNVISLYPLDAWQELNEKLASSLDPRAVALRNYIYGSKINLTIDADGRVIFPKELLNLTKFEYGTKMNVTFVGAGNYIQMWKTPDWEVELEKREEELKSINLTEIAGNLEIVV